MPDFLVLTDEILQIGQDAFDALLDIRMLGKYCRLFIESETPTVCPNCIFNSSTGKSSGKYNGTGTAPFSNGTCPVCFGKGFLPHTTENFVDLVLKIDWEPDTYKFTDETVKAPGNLIQTKGYVTDLPTIIQSKYMIADFPNAVYQNNRYELWGEPAIPGNIIKNRYFECYWKRRGS